MRLQRQYAYSRVAEARAAAAILRDLEGARFGLTFDRIGRGHDRDAISLTLERLIRDGAAERRIDRYFRAAP